MRLAFRLPNPPVVVADGRGHTLLLAGRGFEGDLGDSDGPSDYEDDEDDAIDDVDRPWWSLLADSFRHGLPFVYVIIVLLALAYFIMLLEQQQQRIHRLQSRITNLEQVCTARRKADNLFTASA